MQLFFFQYVGYVDADVRPGGGKKVGDLILIQPYRALMGVKVHGRMAIRGVVYDDVLPIHDRPQILEFQSIAHSKTRKGRLGSIAVRDILNKPPRQLIQTESIRTDGGEQNRFPDGSRVGGGTFRSGDLDFVGAAREPPCRSVGRSRRGVGIPEKGKIERAALVVPLRRHSDLEPESSVFSVYGFPVGVLIFRRGGSRAARFRNPAILQGCRTSPRRSSQKVSVFCRDPVVL